MRQVLVYPGEDGFWVAECPSLPGCISQGVSKENGLSVPEERFDALLMAGMSKLPQVSGADVVKDN